MPASHATGNASTELAHCAPSAFSLALGRCDASKSKFLIQNPLACSARFLRLDNENKLMSKSPKRLSLCPATRSHPRLSLSSFFELLLFFARPPSGAPRSMQNQTDGSQRPSFFPGLLFVLLSAVGGAGVARAVGASRRDRRRDLGRRWWAAFQPGYRRGSRYGIGLAK